jgi:hypothetical protein
MYFVTYNLSVVADKRALFRFTSNATSQGKWYFFLDEHWHHAFNEPDCEKKIAMARFTVDVAAMSGSQYVNQWIRPHFWFVVYADPLTCHEEPPTLNEVIEFEMEFLNPDSSGAATDHFGDEQRGLLLFYSLLVLLYTAGISLYAHRVWITINKGGPMHEVLQMLSLAMGLHFTSAILMLVHLWRYSINGTGIAIFSVLSEVLEMLAQCQMVWMLLGISVGWTISSNSAHPIKNKKQLLINVTVAALHIALVLWEQSYDESHYTYHIHENLPGWLLVLLRLALAMMIGFNLRQTAREERSILKRDFYHSFSIVCYIMPHLGSYWPTGIYWPSLFSVGLLLVVFSFSNLDAVCRSVCRVS